MHVSCNIVTVVMTCVTCYRDRRWRWTQMDRPVGLEFSALSLKEVVHPCRIALSTDCTAP